jgi:hypothetical protein
MSSSTGKVSAGKVSAGKKKAPRKVGKSRVASAVTPASSTGSESKKGRRRGGRKAAKSAAAVENSQRELRREFQEEMKAQDEIFSQAITVFRSVMKQRCSVKPKSNESHLPSETGRGITAWSLFFFMNKTDKEDRAKVSEKWNDIKENNVELLEKYQAKAQELEVIRLKEQQDELAEKTKADPEFATRPLTDKEFKERNKARNQRLMSTVKPF